MYPHHAASIQKLKEYFLPMPGMIAIVLDGSIVKGNERADSDIDALIVVTEECHARLAAENRLAEVIEGHCTYAGGYFDVKYKTKTLLQAAAERASEPTRNAYVKARVLYSSDPDIAPYWNASRRIPNTNGKERYAASMPTCSSTAAIFWNACPRKTPICALTSHRRSSTAYTGSSSRKTGSCSRVTAGWKRRWKNVKNGRRTSLPSARRS